MTGRSPDPGRVTRDGISLEVTGRPRVCRLPLLDPVSPSRTCSSVPPGTATATEAWPSDPPCSSSPHSERSSPNQRGSGDGPLRAGAAIPRSQGTGAAPAVLGEEGVAQRPFLQASRARGRGPRGQTSLGNPAPRTGRGQRSDVLTQLPRPFFINLKKVAFSSL